MCLLKIGSYTNKVVPNIKKVVPQCVKKPLRYASDVAKFEIQNVKTSVKNKNYKNLFRVKNPVHGTLKYGALGFLIPIPGLQIFGMAAGAIAGIVPVARRALSGVITRIPK